MQMAHFYGSWCPFYTCDTMLLLAWVLAVVVSLSVWRSHTYISLQGPQATAAIRGTCSSLWLNMHWLHLLWTTSCTTSSTTNRTSGVERIHPI